MYDLMKELNISIILSFERSLYYYAPAFLRRYKVTITKTEIIIARMNIKNIVPILWIMLELE